MLKERDKDDISEWVRDMENTELINPEDVWIHPSLLEEGEVVVGAAAYHNEFWGDEAENAYVAVVTSKRVILAFFQEIDALRFPSPARGEKWKIFPPGWKVNDKGTESSALRIYSSFQEAMVNTLKEAESTGWQEEKWEWECWRRALQAAARSKEEKKRRKIEEVLLSVLEEPELEVQEFVDFYLSVLNSLPPDETDPQRIRSYLTLNIKLALKSGASWVSSQTQRYKANKMVYSSQYNYARDLVRRKLEETFPSEEGTWDHLEVFPTREMIPRREGEKAKEAKVRALRERSLPKLKEFLRVANATTEEDVLRAIIEGGWLEEENGLLYLEALCSAFKEEELKREGLGGFPLKKRTIRLVRAIRWGDIDPRRQLARLEAKRKVIPLAGPILRERMPGFLQLLREDAPVEKLEGYVREAVGEEKGKALLQLLEKIKAGEL